MARLEFSDEGRGQPIVLLHAFPTDRRIWDGVAGILSQSFRVIRPDLHGFGANPPSAHLSVNGMAGDIAELFQTAGIGPCAVAGLSMGGYIAQALARDHAALVNRLILIDTKAAADAPAARDARDALAALAIEHGSAPVFEKMRPALLGPDASPEIVDRLRFLIESQSPLTIAAASRALRDRDDFSAFLPTLKIPVHLIFGQYDAMMPPDAAKALHSALQAGGSSATLTLIAGAGHLSPLEKSNEVAAAIAASLRSVH